MLDSLRNFATTWPGKILGALLLIGLAGFGITGVLTSIGSNTVARVGDRDISTRDFQRAYQAQINVVANQLGSVPTPQQAVSLGIPSAVLNQLATNASLNILSDEFSLGVSDKRLAEGLRSDPNFSGTLGNFDRTVFERTLQRNGITENDFFKGRRESATRQQIALALFSRVNTPDALNALVQRYGEDRRILEYFVVDELSLLPVSDPGDEVLAAYLLENQNFYRTEELRTIRTIQLSPQIIADGVQVTEADIAAEYEKTKQSLFTLERRTISQARLPSDEVVAQFEAGLAEGKSFETLVSELELTVSEIGTFSFPEMSDPQLAETSFALELDQVEIVSSVLGQRAIVVSNIEAGNQVSLEDASDTISQRLALNEGRAQFLDILDQIEEQRAAFIDIGLIAGEFELKIEEIAVAARGNELVGPMALDPAEAGRVASFVFNTDIGRLSPSVALGANKSVWFDLIGIEEARDQTLSEVRDDVASAWIGEQRTNALEEKANAFVAQIESGQTLADLGVINGLFPQISQPVSRGGDGSDVIDSLVGAAAHLGGEGYVGTTQNTLGAYVVFKVGEITPATTLLSAQDAEFIRTGYRDNIFSDFAAALRQDAQLSVNQGLLNQLLNLGAGNVQSTGGEQN